MLGNVKGKLAGEGSGTKGESTMHPVQTNFQDADLEQRWKDEAVRGKIPILIIGCMYILFLDVTNDIPQLNGWRSEFNARATYTRLVLLVLIAIFMVLVIRKPKIPKEETDDDPDNLENIIQGNDKERKYQESTNSEDDDKGVEDNTKKSDTEAVYNKNACYYLYILQLLFVAH